MVILDNTGDCPAMLNPCLRELNRIFLYEYYKTVLSPHFSATALLPQSVYLASLLKRW